MNSLLGVVHLLTVALNILVVWWGLKRTREINEAVEWNRHRTQVVDRTESEYHALLTDLEEARSLFSFCAVRCVAPELRLPEWALDFERAYDFSPGGTLGSSLLGARQAVIEARFEVRGLLLAERPGPARFPEVFYKICEAERDLVSVRRQLIELRREIAEANKEILNAKKSDNPYQVGGGG